MTLENERLPLSQMRWRRFFPCRARLFDGVVDLDLGAILEYPGNHLDGHSDLDLVCGNLFARPGHQPSTFFQLHHRYGVGRDVFKARWRRGDGGMSEDLPLPIVFLELEVSRQALRAIGARRERGVTAIFALRAHHAAVLEVHGEIGNLRVRDKTDFSKPAKHKSIPPEKMDKGVLADAAHVVR